MAASPITVGTVKEVWRFPVKSMFGETIASAQMAPAGFADDRTWAVRDDDTGEIIGGKKIPKLMMLKARYLNEPNQGFGPQADSLVEIEFPDGRLLRSDDPYANAILSMYCGKRVSLFQRPAAKNKKPYKLAKPMTPAETRYVLGMKADDPDPDFSWFSLKVLSTLSKYATPPGTFYDVYPLHFITTATLDTMNRHYPEGNFCAERYRPSFVIDTLPELEGLVENDWSGMDLRIGDALIRCNHPTIRCSMPGAEQPGIAKDPKVPMAVMQYAGQHLGAYATPRNNGVIRAGDRVQLVPKRNDKLSLWFTQTGRKLKSQLVKVGNHLAEWQDQRGETAAKSQSPHPKGFRPFTLVKREHESSDITSFWFQDPSRDRLPGFIPGQHIVLATPQADGSFVYRPYSLSCSSNDTASYRISVKRETTVVDGTTHEGKGSCSLHYRVNVGDSIWIKDPGGQFADVPSDNTPLTLISAGIGITPFLSILQTAAQENPERSIRLFHGIRSGKDFAFADAIRELQTALPNFRLRLFVSQPGDEPLPSDGVNGRMSAEKIVAELSEESSQQQFMLCGTPAFSKALHDDLIAAGINADQIEFESFGSSQAVDTSDQTQYQIHFEKSQQTLRWDPNQESLLTFTEQQGIKAASGCRYGACQACECTLVSGQVQYPEDVHAPGGKNKVLLCSARPKSDLVIDL
mgnify:CR=1 FL=1